MTMTTTSTAAPAKPQPKPSGLYTVPLGSTETLRKGVAKIQLKATTPIMKQAFAYVFNSSGFWDRVARPAMLAALKAKGITNVRFPSANFYADSNGNLKSPPLVKIPSGYKYYPRKGYDPATGVAFMWLVVS